MDKSRLSARRAQCDTHPIPDALTEVDCDDCGLDPICMVLDYAEETSGVPEGVLLRRRQVNRGEVIFHQNDPFRSILAVKSGSFKNYMVQAKQTHRVIGFQFPGELIGVEAMSQKTYPYTARALEKSTVCELCIDRLQESGRPLEVLQASFIELLGKEVEFNHRLVSSLVHQSADQRIAGFILSISNRLARRGLPNLEFTLTMSQTDIGSYLGLASETVSRVLTRLGRSGAIRLRRKRVLIRDGTILEQLLTC
ncbi:MAG: helix-turn-helix domain-containing protein [Gammaproteobacteria bacterium]|nr:helix-turn-helix domain-containing protein [Gammaproteobacteria bacterium]